MHWLWPVTLLVVLGFFLIYWVLFLLWIEYSKRVLSPERSSVESGEGEAERVTRNTVRIIEYYPQVQKDLDAESSVINAQIMDKLAYRWNMWGEGTLIVYSVR